MRPQFVRLSATARMGQIGLLLGIIYHHIACINRSSGRRHLNLYSSFVLKTCVNVNLQACPLPVLGIISILLRVYVDLTNVCTRKTLLTIPSVACRSSGRLVKPHGI